MSDLFADKQISEALISKHNQALAEYDHLYDRLVELYERSRVNVLVLRDLSAAGRVFGLDLIEPTKNARSAAQDFFLGETARARRETAKPGEIVDYADIIAQERSGKAREEDEEEDEGGSKTAAMPRIRDIVLERLRAAGASGTRAAPIRMHIKQRYGRDIHEKTVGMTLYRLSNDRLAHRVGLTWFFGPAHAGNEEPRR